MKPNQNDKNYRSVYQSDDENVRYKLNEDFFNNVDKNHLKINKKNENINTDDENVRYKFPDKPDKTITKNVVKKNKPKPTIKVNFWSARQSSRHSHKEKSNRRHTVAVNANDSTSHKSKSSTVKVRKQVSFLPSPIFMDNHVPMVTVPDDLTIQLNEEEAIDLGEDLNQPSVHSHAYKNKANEMKRKPRILQTQIRSRGSKRKHVDIGIPNHGNDNELEFFSKYVVQKLRRMETNQRIYSENLINTVLMLGQLTKLSGKSKISDA